MQEFAYKYTKQNLELFKSEDDCYVLCFGIIMLNTLMHNPNVKSKFRPTLKRFIEDHPNVKEELLVEFYENIKQTPFELPQDNLNNELIDKPVKEGTFCCCFRFHSMSNDRPIHRKHYGVEYL